MVDSGRQIHIVTHKTRTRKLDYFQSKQNHPFLKKKLVWGVVCLCNKNPPLGSVVVEFSNSVFRFAWRFGIGHPSLLSHTSTVYITTQWEKRTRNKKSAFTVVWPSYLYQFIRFQYIVFGVEFKVCAMQFSCLDKCVKCLTLHPDECNYEVTCAHLNKNNQEVGKREPHGSEFHHSLACPTYILVPCNHIAHHPTIQTKQSKCLKFTDNNFDENWMKRDNGLITICAICVNCGSWGPRTRAFMSINTKKKIGRRKGVTHLGNMTKWHHARRHIRGCPKCRYLLLFFYFTFQII